jgi:hypothetical protein
LLVNLYSLLRALQIKLPQVSQSLEKQAVSYPFVDGDVIWDYQKCRFFSFWTFVAGIVAGLVGEGE